MKPLHIDAKTISDAWFQLLWNIFNNSYKQTIQKGSFENEQYRLQYPGVSVYIEHPDKDIVPIIPAALGIPAPTTMEYIEDYFANYLMDPALRENETYKYASRIHEYTGYYKNETITKIPPTQLERVIEMLKRTPLTNQAVIEIAKPTDIVTCVGNDGKLDPPCLRLIDFKVIPIPKTCQYCNDTGWQGGSCPGCSNNQGVRTGKITNLVLTVSVYFRSWDLWAGFPSNLGGIELLKQYVAQETGLVNGTMYAYSAGLHIYGYQEELARIRTMKNTTKF